MASVMSTATPTAGVVVLTTLANQPFTPYSSSSDVSLSPLAQLDGDSFLVFSTFVTWVSCMYVGLGSEIVLGRYLVEVFETEKAHALWLYAQLLFPLCLNIAVCSRSYLALPFMVIGLWKCGFPETIGYLTDARNPANHPRRRISDLLNGVGTLVHHGCAAWVCVCFATGLIPFNRVSLSCTLPLVMQHWLVLSKYVSHAFYCVSLIAIEVLWEWECINLVANSPYADRNVKTTVFAMLCAHWMYFIAGGLEFSISRDETSPAATARRRCETVVRWSEGLQLGPAGLGLIESSIIKTAMTMSQQQKQQQQPRITTMNPLRDYLARIAEEQQMTTSEEAAAGGDAGGGDEGRRADEQGTATAC